MAGSTEGGAKGQGVFPFWADIHPIKTRIFNRNTNLAEVQPRHRSTGPMFDRQGQRQALLMG
jgi:hypothetical protein